MSSIYAASILDVLRIYFASVVTSNLHLFRFYSVHLFCMSLAVFPSILNPCCISFTYICCRSLACTAHVVLACILHEDMKFACILQVFCIYAVSSLEVLCM